MRDIVLWGATGQSRVLNEALLGSDIRLVALIDNRPVPALVPGVTVLHGERGLDGLIAEYDDPSALLFSVAVGGPKGLDRLHLFEAMHGRGLTPYTIIHRTAFVAANAILGEACQILAMAAVCSSTRLGRAVIVNTSASVDHDCAVGDGVHIAPGARLAGEITVGARAFIGTGAIILPGLRIGEDAVVGAGAIVTRNVQPRVTVVGNPAHTIS